MQQKTVKLHQFKVTRTGGVVEQEAHCVLVSENVTKEDRKLRAANSITSTFQ